MTDDTRDTASEAQRGVEPVAPLTVTVRDNETGVVQSRDLPLDEYLVITTGSCRYQVDAHANGTHVVTIKGRKAGL